MKKALLVALLLAGLSAWVVPEVAALFSFSDSQLGSGVVTMGSYADATPTSTPPPAVGGIAELPRLAATGGDPSDVPPDGSSEWSAGTYAALVGLAAAAVLALAGAAWYARSRLGR